MAEYFADHMKATGAKAGYYYAMIRSGNATDAPVQRVLDHSSALYSQGFRWTGPETCELWLGSVVRTYRFHSERGETLRAFVGTVKVGRQVLEIDGYAGTLETAQRLVLDTIKSDYVGHNTKFYGVQWKSKVNW